MDETMALTTKQWIMIVTMLAASLVVAWALRQILSSILKRLVRRFNGAEPDKGLIVSVARSAALVIVSETVSLLVPAIELSDLATQRVAMIFDALSISFLAIALYRLVDLVCTRGVLYALRSRQDGHDIAETLAPLVASTLKVVVAVIGIMTVLGFVGVNVAAIITGLSIGGAALALASQDTVKNVFGSLVIITDRPFVVGDWISTPGAEGVVKEIGFRSTRIATPTGSLLTLSNGKLADAVIDNVGVKRRHPMSTSIVVHADSPLDTIERFVAKLREHLAQSQDVLSDAPMDVALSALAPQGITIAVTFHIRASQQAEAPSILHRLHLTILRLIAEESLTLAKASA
jgi:MscS family membrane protein